MPCCGLKLSENFTSEIGIVPSEYLYKTDFIPSDGMRRRGVKIRPGQQHEKHVPTIPNSLVHNLYAHGIRYVMVTVPGEEYDTSFSLSTRTEEQILMYLCDALGYQHTELT